MTSATRQVLYIIAGIVVAVAALYGLYAIATGSLTVPDDVQTKFWGALGLGLILVMTYLQQQNANRLQQRNEERAEQLRANSNANAAATQDKVETLVARVEDGLSEKISSITLDKVTAANVLRAAEDAAQRQREDFAAMKAQVEQIAILMADRAAVPVVVPVPPVVAAVLPVVTTAVEENTAALGVSTDAINANTEGRLTVLETQAEKPKEQP